ncbi:hypothetical protein [Ruegeria sp. Alg231-54]|nr:hypothetical protein [Ruegeria sp. Alg231-54]
MHRWRYDRRIMGIHCAGGIYKYSGRVTGHTAGVSWRGDIDPASFTTLS